MLVVVPRDQADRARRRRAPAGRARKIESGSAGRDVHDDDVVGRRCAAGAARRVGDREQVAQHPDHRRDAGAGGDEEQLAAVGCGSTNSPAACSRWTSVPGRRLVDEVVADQAVGHGLDGDRDAGRRRGGRGSASRRATGGRRRRRCRCGGTGRARGRPSRRRADHDGGGVARSRRCDRDDPAAQVGAARAAGAKRSRKSAGTSGVVAASASRAGARATPGWCGRRRRWWLMSSSVPDRMG